MDAGFAGSEEQPVEAGVSELRVSSLWEPRYP
jgi:hypothetical protein